MKKIYYLLSCLSFYSCELVLDVDVPGYRPTMVMASAMNPDSTITVSLARDRFILDNAFLEFDGIQGANIQIFEGDVLFGTMTPIEVTDWNGNVQHGTYNLDRRPTAGRTYRVEASREGYETISATAEIPGERGTIVSTSHRFLESEFFSTQVILDIEISDPVGKDYYQLRMWEEYTTPYFDQELGEFQEDSLVTYRQELWMYSESIVFEEYLQGDNIFDDNLFDGRRYNLQFETNFLNYYTFDEEGNPSGNNYAVFIELRRLSEAYYNYLQTSILQDWVDGDPFAEPVQVYSNVENGRGVLGSYYAQQYQIEFD